MTHDHPVPEQATRTTAAGTAYVSVIGERPVAVSATLEEAQAYTFTAETRYWGEDKREFRWDHDERVPEEHRLMSRPRDPQTGRGKGRWSWTVRAVHAVPTAAGGGV